MISNLDFINYTKRKKIKYYVIDINSDVPDAFFETYEEASVYQKDFAEHHEYVIVKTKENYSVYNMEPKINLSEEKYKK